MKRRLKLLRFCFEAGPVYYRYYRCSEYPMDRAEAFREAAKEMFGTWRAFRRPPAT